MFAYENLEVYRKAYTLNKQIYQLLKTLRTIPRYIKDQLGRASLSIMLNIAEGSAKVSNKDRKNYYTISRGSTFECAALVSFLCDEQEISKELKIGLLNGYEEISKILYVMIKNLMDKPGR
jgi:four helix bundle protein